MNITFGGYVRRNDRKRCPNYTTTFLVSTHYMYFRSAKNGSICSGWETEHFLEGCRLCFQSREEEIKWEKDREFKVDFQWNVDASTPRTKTALNDRPVYVCNSRFRLELRFGVYVLTLGIYVRVNNIVPDWKSRKEIRKVENVAEKNDEGIRKQHQLYRRRNVPAICNHHWRLCRKNEQQQQQQVYFHIINMYATIKGKT